MTSWQDEQPTSRRALRESERKHVQALLAAEDESDDTEMPADQQIWRRPMAPEPLNYVTQGRAPAADSRPKPRRAQSENPSTSHDENAPYRLRDFSPDARGSAFTATRPKPPMPWTPPSEGSGDLDYHTAVDANRPQSNQRDSASDSPPNLVTTGTDSFGVDEGSSDELNIPSDVTLTRRELRAMRNAAATQVDHRTWAGDQASGHPTTNHEPESESAAPDSATPGSVAPESIAPESIAFTPAAAESAARNASFDLVQPEPRSSQAPRPETSAELLAAMAEFDALYKDRTAEPELDEPVLDQRVLDQRVLDQRVLDEPVVDEPVVDEPVVDEPVLDSPALDAPDVGVFASDEIAEPFPSQWTTAGPPLASEQAVDLPAVPPDPATAVTVEPDVAGPITDDPSREFVTAPEVYTPPTGHWSTQAGIDDKTQTADHVLSRDLAAIDAITTNALVLPNFPTSGTFTGPVGTTGEILITGSFDLPSSVG
ncbi:MAG: hypothetical protein ABIW81_04330, partial [Terrimesophilobacter sp.]